ncbi:Hypothetical predicted protein, partial [Mytilus galloprovincialis]
VTSDEDRDSSSEEESRPVKSTMKSKSSKLKVVSDEDGNSSSEEENKPVKSTTKPKPTKVTSDEDSDSSSEEESEPVKSTGKKKTSKVTSDGDSDSSSEEESKPVKSTGKKKTSKKSTDKTSPEQENKYVKTLKSLCSQCGKNAAFHLRGLNTNVEKIEKLKSILRDLGMKGKPSKEQVPMVLLRKEAAELDCDNIIGKEKVIGQRNARSKYNRHDRKPQPVAPHVSPVKFSRIKDLIESEESD